MTDSEKIRISLDVTTEMKAIIEGLAEADGVSQGEMLRRAIALFKVAVHERKMGREIAILKRDGSVGQRFVWY